MKSEDIPASDVWAVKNVLTEYSYSDDEEEDEGVSVH